MKLFKITKNKFNNFMKIKVYKLTDWNEIREFY